ncbi:MAG: heat-shock protein Hsp20 [Candidatus Nitrosopolaris wilkensis]|nr:MAG: heat-shock protein Hsp20 [Candidatus Nitrosopolaris wilkensis]
MWECDIESYDWFRRFDSRYFADDLFTDFEEVEKIFEDAFMDIKATKELMIDYEIQKDVGVEEFSSFVYGYSMTMELDDRPHVREIRNIRIDSVGSSGSSKKRKRVSKYNSPQITSEREPLAEVNVYDKEVKVVLEIPGVSKEHIKIQAYKNSVEVCSDHPQRKYQVIDIPQVADIKTIRSTYKNGILEIVFKKKEKLKRNNKGRELRIE